MDIIYYSNITKPISPSITSELNTYKVIYVRDVLKRSGNRILLR